MSCIFYAKSMMHCVIWGEWRGMPPPGLEPGLPASEADALSSELRGRLKEFFHRAGQLSNAGPGKWLMVNGEL